MAASSFTSPSSSSHTSSSSSSSTRDKVRQIIDDIGKANQLCESARISFSRACRGCSSVSPADRHASVACGHAVCSPCAKGKAECPDCKKTTRFVKMVENVDRSCCICLSESPRFLDVFSRCGHVICSACSKRMRMGPSSIPSNSIACPLCRVESAPFSLVETAQGDLPQGAFPDVERASVLFEAIEKTEERAQPQRFSFAARNGAANALPNYFRQRNAQLRAVPPVRN